MFRRLLAGSGAVGASGAVFYMLNAPVLAEQQKKTRIAVVGAGTAGITVASQLLIKDKNLDITIIDGATKHYYQPLWTMVGAGLHSFASSERKMADVIPKGAKWVNENVGEVLAEKDTVVTASGKEVEYDYLVVAPGIKTNWSAIPGLQENLGKHGVVSNYNGGECTLDAVKNLDVQNGARKEILFTYPDTAIKCGGAPQKAMYLSEDYWRSKKVDMSKIAISFFIPTPTLFGVKKYSDRLAEICQERGITPYFKHSLKEISVSHDGAEKFAVFSSPDGEVKRRFDILHVSPPMVPHPFLKDCSLTNDAGYVSVDKNTLQSTVKANVFSLGDASNIPTSKTAAAICSQAPVVVHNLLAHSKGEELKANYNGYTSCPLVTGKGKLLLCEFGFGGTVMESMPWDQRWDNGLRGRFHYFLKDKVFPWAYWNMMLKGRWFGPAGPFAPSF